MTPCPYLPCPLPFLLPTAMHGGPRHLTVINILRLISNAGVLDPDGLAAPAWCLLPHAAEPVLCYLASLSPQHVARGLASWSVPPAPSNAHRIRSVPGSSRRTGRAQCRTALFHGCVVFGRAPHAWRALQWLRPIRRSPGLTRGVLPACLKRINSLSCLRPAWKM